MLRTFDCNEHCYKSNPPTMSLIMKKFKHDLKITFFFLLVLELLSTNGNAQDISNQSLVDELNYLKAEKVEIFLSSATKSNISLSKVPGSVTVITMDKIRKSNAKTIADLLRMVAGVHVRQNPMTQTITMRGFDSNPFTSRVLLLIDGVPYNDWTKGGFTQQPGLDFFPLENVKQLEVIRGPGSALYGENAQWGILNIKTISGEDIDGVRATHYLGSRDTEITNLQVGKQINKDFSLLATGKYLRSQFPTSFWFDEASDPNVRAMELFLKGRYKNLTASYYRYDDKANGYTENVENPLLPPDAVFKSAKDIKQTAEIYALNYKQNFADNKYSFSSDVSYAARDGSHCGTCHAAPENENFDGRKQDHGFQAIGDFRLGIHALAHQDILIGAEVRRVDAGDHKDELSDHLASGELDETEDNHVNAYTKAAFYVQDIVSLLDDKLNITLGGRYDSQTYPKLFKAAFSPRAALVYAPTDQLTLRASWGKAFRFPTSSELYQSSWFFNVQSNILNTAFPLAIFKPNPNLKREQIVTSEIGAEYKFNSFFTSKINLYHSTIKDSIVLAYNTTQPVVTLSSENHGNKANVMGGELEFLFDFDERIHGFANWSFKHTGQDGNHLDSAGNSIEFTYAPKHQLNFGGYIGPFYGISTAIEYSWQSSYKAPSFWTNLRNESADPIGDYGYLNLRLNYKPSFTLHKTKDPLMFSIYFKNLLNNQPEESFLGTKSTAPGRELFFGVEAQF